MAIYMFKGTYTDASIKAMVKKPVDRSGLISKACKAFGGKLLSIYMAFGDDDVIFSKSSIISVTEAPDLYRVIAFSKRLSFCSSIRKV